MHVVHHNVESGQDEQQEIGLHEQRHIEAEIPGVRQRHRVSAGFDKVRNVAQNHHSLTEYAQRIKWYPHGVSQPGEQAVALLQEAGNVVWVAGEGGQFHVLKIMIF